METVELHTVRRSVATSEYWSLRRFVTRDILLKTHVETGANINIFVQVEDFWC